MKYITYAGDETKTYKHDYNTDKLSEAELLEIVAEWTKEDNDGTQYFLADDGEISLNEYNQMITLLHGIVTGKASEYYHEYIVDHIETDHCKLLAQECGILEKVKGIIEEMRKADYGIETSDEYWSSVIEDWNALGEEEYDDD